MGIGITKSMRSVRIIDEMAANLKAPRRRAGSSMIASFSSASLSTSFSIGCEASCPVCDELLAAVVFPGDEICLSGS